MAESTQPLNLARIVHRLLTNPRGWDREVLMEELGIAERTYRKYRKNLEDLFEPWFQDGTTRLEEIKEGERRFLRLREPSAGSDEVMELVQRLSAFQLAGQVFEFLGGEELGTALADQAQRVSREGRRSHPGTFSRLMGHLDRLFVNVPDAPKDYSGQEEKLRVLINALVYQRELAFGYDAANGERREHSVEPLTLAMFKGGLYLIARYPQKSKPYKFVVDRIDAPAPVEGRFFSYPSPQDYDPKALHEDVLGIFVDPAGEQHDVELVFPDVKWLKYYVREREWQKGQQLKDLSDGRLRLRFSVMSLVEVVPFVLQFGHEVEVLGPPALQDAIASARGSSPSS